MVWIRDAMHRSVYEVREWRLIVPYAAFPDLGFLFDMPAPEEMM
jgi:hypothetical protein